MKHARTYYVGGMLSLAILPILLFLSTPRLPKDLPSYGAIEIVAVEHGLKIFLPPPPERSVRLTGQTDGDISEQLQTFCATIKSPSDTIYVVDLPRQCTYNLFVRVLDELRERKCVCGVAPRTIRFAFRPDIRYQQTYERTSLSEECQFIRSEASHMIDSVASTFGIGVRPDVLTIDMGGIDHDYPGEEYGELFVTPAGSAVKHAPRSAVLFQVSGPWLFAMLVTWFVLAFLSLIRAKLLPNQRLHPAPRLGQRGIYLSHL